MFFVDLPTFFLPTESPTADPRPPATSGMLAYADSIAHAPLVDVSVQLGRFPKDLARPAAEPVTISRMRKQISARKLSRNP